MKESENKVKLIVDDGSKEQSSGFVEDDKSKKDLVKKSLIFGLMGVVFTACIYLIFKPSTDKNELDHIGLNDMVPQASEPGMQSDKQKAYEQDMLEQKDLEKRNSLTTLSDYWNAAPKESSGEEIDETLDKADLGNGAYGSSSNRPLHSYQQAQHTLGSFYQDNSGETIELRRQLDELKSQLAERDIPKPATVDDQIALMEKSYEMAAKYLPAGGVTNTVPLQESVPVTAPPKSKKEVFVPVKATSKTLVSALYREPSDSAFLDDWSQNKNRGFYTAGTKEVVVQPKNSIRATIYEEQTVVGESGVRLRLMESAQTPSRIIPAGTVVTAMGKFQGGRLQLKISSVEYDGHITPVDITIYDLDGQPGLHVPHSAEMNALSEIAANMSQTSGQSIMLTQSAGQQVAADLSRGAVQGISGYFAKKVRTPKVSLKAGHQVFLVSKK